MDGISGHLSITAELVFSEMRTPRSIITSWTSIIVVSLVERFYCRYLPGLCIFYAFVIFLFSSWVLGQIEITNGPKTVFVQVGETARFDCQFTGGVAVPRWKINNEIPISSSRLQSPYEYSIRTQQLIVNNVKVSMNNYTFQCLFNDIASTIGYLIVCIGVIITHIPGIYMIHFQLVFVIHIYSYHDFLSIYRS